MLPDGRRALSASQHHKLYYSLRLWDLDSGAELHRFAGHEGEVTAVVVLAGGRRALSSSEDRTLRLWDLDGGRRLGALHLDAAPACLAIGRCDQAVVGDGLVRLHWIAIQPSEPRQP